MIRNQVPVQQLFDAVLPELYHHYIDGTRVVMCHYPLLTWDKAHHGSYMLHGHVHSTVPVNDTHRRYDVGVDANDYAPVSWEYIKRTLDKIEKAEPSDVRASRNAARTNP